MPQKKKIKSEIEIRGKLFVENLESLKYSDSKGINYFKRKNARSKP